MKPYRSHRSLDLLLASVFTLVGVYGYALHDWFIGCGCVTCHWSEADDSSVVGGQCTPESSSGTLSVADCALCQFLGSFRSTKLTPVVADFVVATSPTLRRANEAAHIVWQPLPPPARGPPLGRA
ncbi:hypothetical protein [Botrimarina hoheduenensis]|uniref:DUF2946 domain-containing protein n=1 Tax=Botrimarina hoheduenensis TaxID=2528000 RepID=A0A5C5VZL9_9BACT|nr:hypothetical protein [Botrimarina hoheduenensis]TWT43231.1 hypothetical protein Pla111_21810 [Botrimarina hoheduenensis]